MKLEHREADFSSILLNDRFLLVEKINAGGMSLLYAGRDLVRDAPIVVKIGRAKDNPALFKREIRIVRSLQHPTVQKTLASGSTSDFSYYVMPYYGDLNFREFLAVKTVMSEMEMLRYFLQITDAVSYLHKRKILHNDLKPQNIFVCENHQLILSDFGLACRASRQKYVHPDQKTIWGSPIYLAPELPQGFNPSYASDVYALGIILFILVLGYPPFYHDDLEVLIRMHQTLEPPHPCLLSDSISAELEESMLRALAKSPSDRFKNASEFNAALNAYCQKNSKFLERNKIERHPESFSFDRAKTKPIPANFPHKACSKINEIQSGEIF